jgi:nucleoside-diphosphate-sugar epimerase
MKVAITGAGGFLGRALVARLRESGYEPLALVKKEAAAEQYKQAGVESIASDLSCPGSCLGIFDNCQAVIHCAALTRDFGRWNEFKQANIDTTRYVMAAVAKTNSLKVIHISTTAIYGNERNHYGTDEEADYGQRIVDYYSRSKIEADRIVLQHMQDGDLPATILRFGNIWGPGDPTITPFIINGLKSKRLMLEGGGDNVLSLTYIDNAIESILLALANDSAIGKIFNITDGGKVTSRKFIQDIINILGIEYNLKNIPYPLLYSTAFLIEQYFLFTRKASSPVLTRFAARFLKYHAFFDISQAINTLGYRPRISYKEGLTQSTPYIRSLYYGHK